MPANILWPKVSRFFVLLLAVSSSVAFGQVIDVRLNEVMANNITNIVGGSSGVDWLELFNPSPQTADVSDMSLSDSASNPRKWVFPAGSSIPGNGYLVVLLDPDRPATTNFASQLNAGFSLKATGDAIYLFAGTLLDSLVFGLQAGDYSLGRVGTGWSLNTPTPGGLNAPATLGAQGAVKINEWMASPSSGDDWFELYNSGTQPVSLGGLYLTDTSANKTNSLIPAFSFLGTGVNAYVRIWADDNPQNGANHASFKLSGSGEAIGLYSSPQTSGVQIDYIPFGQQTADVSQGRLPDGSANIVSFPGNPTPGDANFVCPPQRAGLPVSRPLCRGYVGR